jgi:Fur family transcriptional regulator, peroxide stress response regulator
MAKTNQTGKINELVNSFEQVCRLKGLRITHQRTEIFRELARFPGHPTAENVFGKIRKRLKTISLDTVYRTIATFEEFGLIKRVRLLDNSSRFDMNLSIHHHLVCTECNKIEDFYWPYFDQLKLPGPLSNWGIIDSKHVEIRGLCVTCQKKLKKNR